MEHLLSVFIVLKLLFVCGFAQSPCPDVFEYQNNGGQVSGLIKLRPSGPVSSITIMANFSIAARLPSSYVGQLEPLDLQRGLQRYNQGATLLYIVHFPVTSPLPRLTSLVVNGGVICYGPGDTPGPYEYVSTISLRHMLYLQGGANSGFDQINQVKPSPVFNSPSTQVINFSDDGSGYQTYVVDKHGGGLIRPGRPEQNFNVYFPDQTTKTTERPTAPSINYYPQQPPQNYNQYRPQRPIRPPPDYNAFTTLRPEQPPPVYNPYTTLRPEQPPPDYNPYTTNPPPPKPPAPILQQSPIQPPPDYNVFTTLRPEQPSPNYSQYTTLRPEQPPPVYNPYTTLRPEQTPPDYNPYTTNPPPPKPPAPTFPSNPPRPPSGSDLSRVECGIVYGGNDRVPLVHHGQGYERGEWPWLVAIYKMDHGNLAYKCAGTLITNRHVVSAAHCMSMPTPTKDIVVKVGVHNLDEWGDDKIVTRTLESITIHKSYDYTTLANDIVVLTFDKTVEYSTNIRPACLWDGKTDLNRVVGASGVVAGWGSTELGPGGKGEPRMARIPIVSTATCRASHPGFHKLTPDNKFCAGDRNGIGPCLGDSGGGLYILESGRWRLRGVVSVSLRPDVVATTCDLNQYVVFTDAAKFLTWIKDIVQSSQI